MTHSAQAIVEYSQRIIVRLIISFPDFMSTNIEDHPSLNSEGIGKGVNGRLDNNR